MLIFANMSFGCFFFFPLSLLMRKIIRKFFSYCCCNVRAWFPLLRMMKGLRWRGGISYHGPVGNGLLSLVNLWALFLHG